MKMKIFSRGWASVNEVQLENEVNEFLASLPQNAVRHVQTAACATRTAETDQMETEVVITVWYDDVPKHLAPKR